MVRADVSDNISFYRSVFRDYRHIFAVWNLYDIWGDDISAKLMHSKLTTMNRKETITFIGWGMSGLFAILGLIVLNKRANAQQATAEAQKMTAEAQMQSAEVQKETAEAQIQSNKFAEQRYVDEKYEDAIQNLGHKHAGVRIAAYYSLHRLAKTYKNLREVIFTQLCTHLRDITTAPDYAGKTKPTEGVQTLLDILFKSEDSKIIFRGLKANLQRVHLIGADLRGAHMPQTDFSNACLINADMRFARLHKSYFSHTKMQNAILVCAEMPLATFYATKLIGAHLFNANFQQSYMIDVAFYGAGMGYSHQFSSCGTQMQNAGLHLVPTQCNIAYLGGVYDNWSGDFCSTITARIGKPGIIEDIIFFGDENRMLASAINDTVKFLAEFVNEKSAQEYKKDMREHIGKNSRSISGNDWQKSNFIVTPYTKEQADEWIAEYKEAMGDISDNQK